MIVYGRRMRDPSRTAEATRAVQRRRRERLVDELAASPDELLSDQARAQIIQLADRLRVPAGAR
jgi:hypothetical protein